MSRMVSWLTSGSRVDKLDQLVQGAPSREVSHHPDSLFLDFKISIFLQSHKGRQDVASNELLEVL